MELKISQRIGSGTYGNVYLTNRDTALRIISVKPSDFLEVSNKTINNYIKVIQQEIDIMRCLDHPHLPTLLFDQMEKVNDNIVFRIEMTLGGKHLEDHTSFSSEQNEDIMRQVLEAVVYLHENQIIHGDIKPHNILVDTRGKVMLVDFTLSVNVSDLIDMVKIFDYEYVTLQFRPPELLLKGPDHVLSTAIDIWSLGCVWYYLQYGRYPFRGCSMVDQTCKIFQILGTPTLNHLPNLAEYTRFKLDLPVYKRKDHILTTDEIFQKIFVYNPQKRITAKGLLALF